MSKKSSVMNVEKPVFSLSLNTLKYIAVAAMLIDHIAFSFVTEGSTLAIMMHFIGKIAGPIMFFAAVEGYHHTQNLNRYLARLAAFAVISWVPFIYFRYGEISMGANLLRPNVIYTILLGVLAVHIRRACKNPFVKTTLILALIVLCIPADWGTLGIIIIIVFDYFYGNFNQQAFGYSLLVLLYVGVLNTLIYPFQNFIFFQNFGVDANYFLDSAENIGMFIPIVFLRFYKNQKSKSGHF